MGWTQLPPVQARLSPTTDRPTPWNIPVWVSVGACYGAAVSSTSVAVRTLHRRALLLLLAAALTQVVFVLSYRGEFWPFSSFCMFSRAGKPWVRALVRRIEPDAVAPRMTATYSLQTLPGQPFTVTPQVQNDLSKLVQRAQEWTALDRSAVIRALRSEPCREPLLLLSVEGSLAASSTTVVAKPVAVVDCNSLTTAKHALLQK